MLQAPPRSEIAPEVQARTQLVDVFVQQRTARVDRPLTYRARADDALCIGDVVRVPLGPRELFGFVVAIREGDAAAGVRDVIARASERPAFDGDGLALARWIAARYCCSLGEALACVAFAPALPRAVDRFVVVRPPDPADHPTIAPRIVRLIASDLATGFRAEAFLRHPEARRAGDRETLRAALAELQRAGVIRRERAFLGPSVGEKRERFLHPTGVTITGTRARALVESVETAGSLRHADALLAGFSRALIARALREGALRETHERVVRTRGAATSEDGFTPTYEQTTAIDAIVRATRAATYGELLLQGITGSGKTLVYLRAIAAAIAAGGRAIVLVPEISLTPQTARRFEAAFGKRVAVLHSALSERDRFESWTAAARGEVDVVVGARSAVFAPLENVRLIVIDEAHEGTYKQDSTPRYNAVDVARERMRLANGTLVLGSATPPLEAYRAALAGEIAHLRLDARATAQPLPTTTIVDLGAEFERGNRRIFSGALVAAIGARLACGEKTVLFVNRRGSARFVLCRACGAVPECDRCSVSLVAHRSELLLRCHLCDAQRPLPETCPACGAGPIREFGVGTQTVAQTVATLFPAAHVVRMDSDTTTRIGDHARLLDEFATRGDILVGTQMIAKGLDFPTVTLVGVVAADAGLHASDFRAAERTFNLITQVAGRSGRARPGEAIVQTYAPTHPAIARAAAHDFDGFAASELAQRRDLRYPPFAELVYVGIIGRDRVAVERAAAHYAELLARLDAGEVLGPAPYAIARVNDEWRYRIAVKANDAGDVRRFLRDELLHASRAHAGVRIAINADP